MAKNLCLLFLSGFVVIAHAIISDWATPCFGGCAYDVSNSHLKAAVYVSGSQAAVSDLTPAAGWNILDCAAQGQAQDVRAICNSTDTDSPCNHLFQGGAVGTIVRLPEECTNMQFARIAAAWNESTLNKPDADVSAPTVHVFSLDANFSAIETQHGKVNFWVQTANMPVDSMGFAIPPEVMLVSGNETISTTPVAFNKYATIFNESVDCPQSGKRPELTGSVLVGINAAANTSLDYGVYAAGTVTPPNVTEFQLYATFDGIVDGVLNVNTTAGATIDSGQIQIFSTPIGEGIDIAGILTVGPIFTVYVEGVATIDVELNVAAGVNYTWTNAEMYYPSSSNTTSGGTFEPGNTDVSLDGEPDINVDTTLTAHLIPTISFGIDAFHGYAEAEIVLQFDTSVGLSLDLEKSASASITNITGSKSKAEETAFNGTVSVLGGLDVSAGADTDFFHLFKGDPSLPLYQKTFTLFHDNFGDSGPSKRDVILVPRRILAQTNGTNSTGSSSGNNTIKCFSN